GLKIGILHLQHGVWQARRILSERWVKEATRKHAGRPGDEYGYHWVIGDGWYAALGVFVQMVQVFPAASTVLAINGAIDESSVLLPHIRRHFPAGFGGGTDAGADAALAQRLAAWSGPAQLRSIAAANPPVLEGRWTVCPNDKGVTALDFAFAGNR